MKKLLFLAAFICLMGISSLQAALLKDRPVTLTQPDGSVIECLITGDENFAFLHTRDGYVMMKGDDDYYYFAKKEGAKLVPTEFQVLKSNPTLLPLDKWIMPDKSFIDAKINENLQYQKTAKRNTNSILDSKIGNYNNIVIFIYFADQQPYTDSLSKYETMYNATSGSSVKNFYKEASYNKFDVTTSFYPYSEDGVHISAYQAPHPRNYYCKQSSTKPEGYNSNYDKYTREQDLITGAIDLVADMVQESEFFNVTFIVQDTANNDPQSTSSLSDGLLWPHKSTYGGNSKLNGQYVGTYNLIMSKFLFPTSTSTGDVGTTCHEMFHSIGAPDIYHYSYDGFTPVGEWELMEGTKNPPQHMEQYLKWQYTGWLDSLPEITAEGQYYLNPVTSATNNVYKLACPTSTNGKEFFILEYRHKAGTYESSLPGTGLLVYRINTAYDKMGNAQQKAGTDEIYLFRPNGSNKTPPYDSPLKANLGKEVSRPEISNLTNGRIYLSDGVTGGGVDIYDITYGNGDKVAFKVGFTQNTIVTYPTDSSMKITLTPAVKWRKVTGASTYRLQISSDPNFVSCEVDANNLTDTTYTPTAGALKNGTTYYARAMWTNSTTTSHWSCTINFTTIIGTPTLISPSNTATDVSLLPKFTWSSLTGASSYMISVASDANFANTVITTTVSDTTYTPTTPLSINKTYYWRVKTTSSNNGTSLTNANSFTTQANALLIASQTQSKGLCAGAPFTAKVSALGSALHFQWYKDNAVIASATDSTYAFTAFSAADNGTYVCKVTSDNVSGKEISSENIVLGVLGKLSLVQDIANGEYASGASTTLKAEVTGSYYTENTDVTFQWYYNGAKLTNGSKYNGAASSALTVLSLASSDTTGVYSLKVWSNCGDTLTSNNARISAPVSVVEETIAIAGVSANISPNPTSDKINIRINSTDYNNANISLFNINGVRVANLFSGILSIGETEMPFNVDKLNLSSGVYYIVIDANNQRVAKKIEIIR